MSALDTYLPSSSFSTLSKRAGIISTIRHFFSEKGILEVETPYLSQATVTDTHLCPFKTYLNDKNQNLALWLITSPEYHMKRLLAADSGPIFQLCRSFRNGERGCYHNPEFTMLEWYRPCYGMHELMFEVEELIKQVLMCKSARKFSYQEIFQQYLDIDPLDSNISQLIKAAEKNLKLNEVIDLNVEKDYDALLQLVFSIGIQPALGKNYPTFVYHFPASQAALSQMSKEDNRVAERFELYFKGIELANGSHELTEVCEHKKRFNYDNCKRQSLGLPRHPVDEQLIAALESGLPDCSGVALGVDRLVMLALGKNCLEKVISFTSDRA